MMEKKNYEIRGLTFAERNSMIEAGLDQNYCDAPDMETNPLEWRQFFRKQIAWILTNIFKADLNTVDDFQATKDAVRVLELTSRGQKEAEKN